LHVYSKIKPNPTITDLLNCLKFINNQDGVEVLIGIGGGSVLDVSKLAALFANQKIKFKNYQDLYKEIQKVKYKKIITCLIPTTSGTGSECTSFSTLWDMNLMAKHSYQSIYNLPDYVILDYRLTLSLNSDQTLFPALDSLSHALESLWNKNCNDRSRKLAYESLNKLNRYLPILINNLNDEEARKEIQIASHLSGQAISHTQTSIAHGISYYFTLYFKVPHGLACSFTLSHILKKNLDFMYQNKIEHNVLVGILELLNNINLKKIIMHRYLGNIKFNDSHYKQIESNLTSRVKNYSGNDLGNIKNLLDEVLNYD